jgi:hypothetical protein
MRYESAPRMTVNSEGLLESILRTVFRHVARRLKASVQGAIRGQSILVPVRCPYTLGSVRG